MPSKKIFSEIRKSDKKTVFMVAAVLIAAFLASADFVMRPRPVTTLPGAQLISRDIPEITRAPEGELIEGFPQEFLLEDGAKVTASMLSNYKEIDQRLFFSTYVSKKDITTALRDYKDYVAGLNWEVTNSVLEPSYALLFARSFDAMTQLTVKAIKEAGEVRLSVTVIKK